VAFSGMGKLKRGGEKMKREAVDEKNKEQGKDR